ncbi:UDP-N-acetylmuramoyl-L-alanine--D-glutamate ligase [Paenibacillus sp. YYML68]|uniref:UDP-N-acetylmuramoyl-L-alanine--D-glutamate ligase n=1 Tax=Paenibacillus sp. YYML68 TaxID=2909250 RepID=UPI0024928C85|nr:UDP-N-acetylmuramoyl-L-alanine--D-glutamate ligase [Paenibacillus sp. YYML68]
MEHPSAYRGRRVVVLGLARSGVAVAKWFHDAGALVTVNDKKERDRCPEADELEALGISVVCGEHPPELVNEDVALVVKNPGIPYSIEPIRRAAELGIDTVTEVEVAYFLCKAPMIGITGSNGKTTTTTWTGLMLEAGGLKPIVAGNIGRALTEAALEAEPDNRMVVELSSFQLKGTKQFRPAVACLLNIYETHLDYHGTMEDYVVSKQKLFANQTESDVAVLNWDDSVCRMTAANVRSKVLAFSTKETLDYGLYVQPPLTEAKASGVTPVIVYRDEAGIEHELLPTSELGIPGSHNIENALAASAMAIASGVALEVIARVLREFRGVEHRLEFVAGMNDVQFYNDSKATNPAATTKTIESFQQPIVLIAGGLDRGSDYMELLPVFESRIKGLVAFGETKEKIARVARLAGMSGVKTVDTAANGLQITVNEAVEAAYAMAEPGDVVLLSPACASWDMFPSYEERGRMFKQSVHNLVKGE